MDLTADLPTSCFSNSDSASYILDIIIIGCRDYYMINRQSHAFECNLGIIALANRPNCTRYARAIT